MSAIVSTPDDDDGEIVFEVMGEDFDDSLPKHPRKSGDDGTFLVEPADPDDLDSPEGT